MLHDELPGALVETSGFTPMRWPFRGGRANQSAIPVSAWSLALEHGSEGVLIADMRLRGEPIVHVNPAFEAITGYPASEAIGKNCRYLQGSDRL